MPAPPGTFPNSSHPLSRRADWVNYLYALDEIDITHPIILTVLPFLSHRFIPPPPGWGYWSLLLAPNPWMGCLVVVNDLTYHVIVQQAALEAHRAVMVQTTSAQHGVLDAWPTELDLLCQHQAKVTAVAESIEDLHNALEDADYVYVAG